MLRINYQTMMSGVSMVGTINSAPLELAYMLGYCIQATYTGFPVGTLILQGSNDVPNPMDANFQYANFVPTNWTTIANSSVAISGPDAVLINVSGVYYRYVRASYTAVSGSGLLTIVGNAKGF
jgi:hypothetical protein